MPFCCQRSGIDRIILVFLGSAQTDVQKKDINAPSEVILKKTFWVIRQRSLENITSVRGIQPQQEVG